MDDATAVQMEDLPPKLRELVRLIGLAPAMAIVKHWGGLRIKIPEKYHEDHALVRVAGREAMVKLVDAYAVQNLYIPRAVTAMNALRNVDIVRRLEGGASGSTLAREYGMSERQIWKIAKRPEAARVQRPEQCSLL